MISDINPGPSHSSPSEFLAAGGLLYFNDDFEKGGGSGKESRRG